MLARARQPGVPDGLREGVVVAEAGGVRVAERDEVAVCVGVVVGVVVAALRVGTLVDDAVIDLDTGARGDTVRVGDGDGEAPCGKAEGYELRENHAHHAGQAVGGVHTLHDTGATHEGH